MQAGSTCSERSALILSHLVGLTEADSDVEEIPRLIRIRFGSDFCYERHSSPDDFPKRTSDSDLQLIKHSAKEKRIQSNQDPTIIKVAERFLAGFRSMNLSGVITELRGPDPLDTDISERSCSEPATQAFKCCKSMVIQAKEQLRYATFTRFISLCFFLIWEALACRPGKAGAREACTLNESKSMCCRIDYSSDQCEDEGGRIRRGFEKPEIPARRDCIHQPACGLCSSEAWDWCCIASSLPHLRYELRLKLSPKDS